MKRLLLILLLAPFGAGCTAISLQRDSVQQIASVADLRYQQTMDGLAVVAANLDTLPSLGIMADGTALVVDTYSLDAKTLWARALGGVGFDGFNSTTITPGFSRNPQPSWSVEPLVDPEKLEGAWQAFRCALGRPPLPDSPGYNRLKLLQVIRDLDNLPPDWLHVGCMNEAPCNAVYKSHCGDTWAWVCADGMAGLSALTLVVLDISTVDLNSLRKAATPGSQTAKVVFSRGTGTGNTRIAQTVEMDKQPVKQTKIKFEITADSLNALTSAGVPSTVISNISHLNGEFPTEEALVASLSQVLSPAEMNCYENLIIKYAKQYTVLVSLAGSSHAKFLYFSLMDMDSPQVDNLKDGAMPKELVERKSLLLDFFNYPTPYTVEPEGRPDIPNFVPTK